MDVPLYGGGLMRSRGGWAELKGIRLKGRNRVKGDERILGDTDFVIEVLAEANVTGLSMSWQYR